MIAVERNNNNIVMRRGALAARRKQQSGFTVLELVFSFAILGLIGLNMAMVMRSSSAAFESSVMSKVVGEQAEMTMERIILALMSSSKDQLEGTLATAPNGAPSVNYTTCLGMNASGVLVYGDPERIEYQPQSGSVIWSQNPGLSNARNVVWSQWVPLNLDGEAVNTIDDNNNGLVDEPGLSFDLQDSKVNVNLTLERKDSKGVLFKRTLSRTVTCRN